MPKARGKIELPFQDLQSYTLTIMLSSLSVIRTVWQSALLKCQCLMVSG